MPGPSSSQPRSAVQPSGPTDVPSIFRLAQPGLGQARARDEWLLTNGLGGFAMGTASGIPERKYHAWLIGATSPPVGRVVLLSCCCEWLVVRAPGTPSGYVRHDLSTLAFAGGVRTPGGIQSLIAFERDVRGDTCAWTYELPALGLRVRRELFLPGGANAASVRYRIVGTPPPETYFEVRPFTPLRDFHDLVEQADDSRYTTVQPSETSVRVRSRHGSVVLCLAGDEAGSVRGRFTPRAEWWRDVDYVREREPGQGDREHLFSPGVFVVPVGGSADATIDLVASDDADAPALTSPALTRARAARMLSRDALVDRTIAGMQAGGAALDATQRERAAVLAIAADQFVVKRRSPTGDLSSIIAGYPWFSDWGRDTCIAMPGLLLTTGRFAEARNCLAAFANLRRRGLVPNCFDNGTGQPEYNTVDASLWFLIACCRYLEASGDREGFTKLLRPACLDIIEAYRAGTDFGIKMDPADGLIMAGNAQTQLTWMDAKRDGVVFTPRYGKPVEISALWYAGLLMLARAMEADTPRTAREVQQIADLVARNFEKAFWNEREQCLLDCLVPAGARKLDTRGAWEPVDDIRPNQIFAVSVGASPLPLEKQRSVVRVVGEKLLTPLGLRTLAPGHAKYRPRFEGPLFERDSAYHNGTVWPWLIGPYCEALMRVESFSSASRAKAMHTIEPLLRELMSDTSVDPARAGVVLPVRQLAEVYDAEPAPDGSPRRPDGCMAQAWSVAEVLRVLVLTQG